MKKSPLYIMLFLLSCSTTPPAPDWVANLRSGEERLKLINGNRMLFRRIAGTSYQSRDQACITAVKKVEEDIRTEYPGLEHVPYSLEVMYYDAQHKDCAVTVGVSQNSVPKEELHKPVPARSVAMTRSEKAEKYAISGLSKKEFEAYIKEKVGFINFYDTHGPCWKQMRASVSEHGKVLVCWSTSDQIVGYCTEGVCTSK